MATPFAWVRTGHAVRAAVSLLIVLLIGMTVLASGPAETAVEAKRPLLGTSHTDPGTALCSLPQTRTEADERIGLAEAASPRAVLGGPEAGDPSGIEDEVVPLRVDGPRIAVHGAVVAAGSTRSSTTSPDTGTARGPPVRPGRLCAGVRRPHRLRPTATGVDLPCPRKDSTHDPPVSTGP